MKAVVDLGTRSVALILYEPGARVHFALHAEHAGRPVLDGVVLDVPAAAAALEETLSRAEAAGFQRPTTAAIAVASREMTVRHGRAEGSFERIDEADAAQLTSLAAAEAAWTLPRPDEHLCVDRAVLARRLVEDAASGRTSEVASLVGQRGRAEVELVATFVPRRVVEAKAEVLRRFGIEVEGLCLEPRAALAACAPPLPPGRRVAVVDVGAGTTDLAVAEGAPDGTPRPVALDSMPVAGDEVTERIAEALGVPFAEAERMKRNGDPRAAEVVRAAVREHAREIAARIAERAGEVRTVFLVGGGAALTGLPDAVAEALAQDGFAAEVRVGGVREEAVAGITTDPTGTNAVWATPAGIAALAASGRLLRLAPIALDGVRRILAVPPEGLGFPEVFAAFGRDPADLYGAVGRAIAVRLEEAGETRLVVLPGSRGGDPPADRFSGGEAIESPRPAAGADRAARLADLPRKTTSVEIRTASRARRKEIPWRYRRNGTTLAESAAVFDGDRLEGTPPRASDLAAALAREVGGPRRVSLSGRLVSLEPRVALANATGEALTDDAPLSEGTSVFVSLRPPLVCDVVAAADVAPRPAAGALFEVRVGGHAWKWDAVLPREAGPYEAAWR